MSKTIFEKIIDREIPANIIYEDDYCMCIVDQFPSHKGQLLVFSKEPIDKIYELPKEISLKMWEATQKVSIALQKTYPESRICTITEGFEVPHAHIKIYPVIEDNFVTFGDRKEIESETSKEIRDAVLGNL